MKKASSMSKDSSSPSKSRNVNVKADGGLLFGRGAEFSEGQVGAKFLEGARFLRATMFFCKHVISVATLLLIIHITMYILK